MPFASSPHHGKFAAARCVIASRRGIATRAITIIITTIILVRSGITIIMGITITDLSGMITIMAITIMDRSDIMGRSVRADVSPSPSPSRQVVASRNSPSPAAGKFPNPRFRGPRR